ncbi:hypothetical protein E4N76_02865 [Treponema putidum]|uniref:Uncharacterized protein n=1 Tax=Treponema putidum TaxID=221027 RepID=A0AAE9MY61_9SPIR|nr:hypothetical protein E4N76_02865 [Treponema putidum]UTY32458.1 hypothetical protein E4N75_02400 [Treponema putidum]UTY34856.1 hypothetical protein E4N74_02170 [Treponema putidum]
MISSLKLKYAVSDFVAKRRKISNAQKLMFLPLAYFNRNF